MELTDQALVARVLAHDDRHAFATLVRRHQDLVRRLLRRLTAGDAALADDLAQETFLRAYRGLSGFAGRAKFSSWLYRIAYHLFLNEAEKRKIQRAHVDALSSEPAPTDASETDPWSAARLEKALATLRVQERLSVTLFFAQGLSPEEIADVLDCPQGTVKTHLHRGKEKLRQALEDKNHGD